MEKSAAGKSIINLLLLLLTLGAGAYGLDHLGGTNTAIGKWLKDNLGAGDWGIKDSLNGLFTPAATPAAASSQNGTTTSSTVQTNAAQGTGVASNSVSNNMLPIDFNGISSTMQNLRAGGKQAISDEVQRLFTYPAGGTKPATPAGQGVAATPPADQPKASEGIGAAAAPRVGANNNVVPVEASSAPQPEVPSVDELKLPDTSGDDSTEVASTYQH